ncbi:MAG: transglutaminase-like domain-containing protein [Pirellulales bacterium]
MSRLAPLWLLLCGFTLIACDRPAGGPEVAKSVVAPSVPTEPRDDTADRRPADDSPPAERPSQEVRRSGGEAWDVCRIQGDKVGYVRTQVFHEGTGENRLERIEMEHVLSFQRFGQEVRQELQLVSWEKPTGQLVRFESRVVSGRELTLSRGEVTEGKLTIETTTPGKTTRQSLDWQPEWGGFYAAERALRGPWKPSQRRTVRALVPVLNQMGVSEFEADGYEALRVGGRSETLLKLRRVDTLGATRMESLVWVNSDGEPIKSFISIPAPGMETVRTSREEALAAAKPSQFDLGTSTVVPATGMPADPHAAQQLRLLAEIPDGDVEGLFARGASQQVRKIDATHAELSLTALRPDAPLAAPEEGPTEADRTSNNLVQADDPAIIAFAKEAAEGETDPWKVAVALESLVRSRVKSQNLTQALATASEVVRSGEGDCTEHAVLLAAVCRARGIPARVAIGLVYVPSLSGFAYHMWNEVWINDRWVPLDATLARGGIGVGHVKLKVTPLDGVDAYAAFLPVFQVLGRLKLSVVP